MPPTPIQHHRCKKPRCCDIKYLTTREVGSNTFLFSTRYLEIIDFLFVLTCRCWMSSQFPQMPLVSYVTTMAFPCLVILCNFCMLGLVVFKLWRLRAGGGSSGWKKMPREKGIRLWKDCATVLGLSCVLGLPWGLAGTTYISLSGIYLFTILNSLQGQYLQIFI